MAAGKNRKEIDTPQELLDSLGCVIQEGWARRPLWHLDRNLVSLPHVLIKDWDRFIISDDNGKWLVISSASRIGTRTIYSIVYVDLENRKIYDCIRKKKASSRTQLPQSSDIDYEINYSCPEMRTSFIHRDNIRNLLMDVPDFDIQSLGKGIDARFILRQAPDSETFVSVTTLSKSGRSFLLNEISAPIPVRGILRRGDLTVEIVPADVHAVFDMGRGRFATQPMFKAIFNKGTAGLSMVDEKSCAVSCNGKLHVITGIRTEHTDDGFSVRSRDGSLKFCLKNGMIRQNSTITQLFGSISGHAALEDGTELDLDDMTGVAWIVQGRKQSE